MENKSKQSALTIDNELTERVSNIIREAYRFVEMDSIRIRKKELRDIVTNVDIDLENYIIHALRSAYPTHIFSAEERGRGVCGEKDDIYEWVIDPIDGTINFVNGLPFYTTSICLKHNDIPILGIVYDRSNNDFYYAIKSQGAFLNGKKIMVSSNTDIGNSIFTFMLTSHYNEQQTEKILDIVRKLSAHVQGMRLLVSQALELCYIACGKIDGTVCIKSKGFSSAAGALIVREAGGKVTDVNGNEYRTGCGSLLVTNGLIHSQILSILNKDFGGVQRVE